jgi:hypothetical protein
MLVLIGFDPTRQGAQLAERHDEINRLLTRTRSLQEEVARLEARVAYLEAEVRNVARLDHLLRQKRREKNRFG